MKRQDLVFIGCTILLVCPFFISEQLYNGYVYFNNTHAFIMSFIKFAILATAGEMIGLRILKGVYNEKGFGILPRALVWGILGMGIKLAFIIFSAGTLKFLKEMGVDNPDQILNGSFCIQKVGVAFCISVLMNSIFAPVFMTLHKITDTHILANGGTLAGFFKPIQMGEILTHLNWKVQWDFVFKKTIPFFWFPAHTITFLLPPSLQVLFAALLGVALGIILSIANLKKK